MPSDEKISFKAALLQGRKAELAIRAECLEALEDMTALEKFNKDVDSALETLRQEGKISEDPLAEFLGHAVRVVGWQTKLEEQEQWFDKRIADASKAIDDLVGQGLPADEWAALQSEISGLEPEFQASHAEWQESLPTELWSIVDDGARRNEVLEQLNACLIHARNTGHLTREIGWEDWPVEAGDANSVRKRGMGEREIEFNCAFCNEELRFSIGLAGKTVECRECGTEMKFPGPNEIPKDDRFRLVAKGGAKPAEARSQGLPDGWTDHFDSSEEARRRLAQRPQFDAAKFAELKQKLESTETLGATWRKYFPRIAATGLPFDAPKAWNLIQQDPAQLMGRIADEWPESDWALSARVAGLFAGGDMGLGEGVALLATNKEELERFTRQELRDRIAQLPPILSPDDYTWKCAEGHRVKMTYTRVLETKCPDFNWKHSVEADDELQGFFAEGVSIDEGLNEMLKGKSQKQELSEEEVAGIFDRIRRLPEIASDLICHDGSSLENCRSLPGDWRFHYWEPAEFEKPEWIAMHPIVAVRLLQSELPQIIAEYTGRTQLLSWSQHAQGLLADPDLSFNRKAMLLPVALGFTEEILFIPDERSEEDVVANLGQRPGPLRKELEKAFRTGEIRKLADSEFPDKVALYCDQHWIRELLENEQETRKKGMSIGLKAAAVIGILVVIGAGVSYALKVAHDKQFAEKMAKAEAEASALAKMVLKFEIDYSNISTNIDRKDIVIELNGKAVQSESKLGEGNHEVVISHPHLRSFRKSFATEYGEGMDLGKITLSPAMGSVSVESDPPGVEVSIGGRPVGKTPLKLGELPVGPVEIALTAVGYGTWKTNANVPKEQNLSVAYRFGRGTVKFSTQPAGFYYGVGAASAGVAGLDWNGSDTPTTPADREMLPGDYLVAFVHPTMGASGETGFVIADKDAAQVDRNFPVASANIAGLPAGSKYWRGARSLGAWMNWDSNWKFDTSQSMTLFRLWRPGFQPRAYALQYQGGAFSSPFKSALEPARDIECWGSDSRGQCSIPDALKTRKFIDIAAGKNHTVALLDDLTVACWGDNSSGQCGVPGDLGACMMIAAGENHTVALQVDGKVVCWGNNQVGQSGVPDDLGACVSISAAGNRTAVLRADGGIRGWGYAPYQVPAKTPWQPYVSVNLGAFYITAIDDAGVPAIFTQTQSGVGSPSAEATAAASGGPFIDVSGGTTYAIWLKPDGSLVGVGNDRNIEKLPNAVAKFRSVDASFKRVIGIAQDGSALIWGRRTGMTTRGEFERKTDEATRLVYWYRTGTYVKAVAGENHYVALKR